MQAITQGQYFGTHRRERRFDHLIITETEYTHPRVDWHYHENPYFTFLVHGKLYEANRKEDYHLRPGSLVFHNWQDAHYNIMPDCYTQGFHIELTAAWFAQHEVTLNEVEGSFQVENPDLKVYFEQIYRESLRDDAGIETSINMLLVNILCGLSKTVNAAYAQEPMWVKKVKEALREGDNDMNLSELAQIADVHPVHLCRDFPRYFHCSLSDYKRKLNLNRALELMRNSKLNLTAIAHASGFADQSHFNRIFKHHFGTTPLQYRRLIS